MDLTRRNSSAHRPEAESPYHPDRLAHDGFGHLALALGAVHEDDRHLDDAKTLPPCPEAHLDLEGIAVRPNIIEVNGFQNFPAKTLEAASGVPYRESRHHPSVDVGEVA